MTRWRVLTEIPRGLGGTVASVKAAIGVGLVAVSNDRDFLKVLSAFFDEGEAWQAADRIKAAIPGAFCEVVSFYAGRPAY